MTFGAPLMLSTLVLLPLALLAYVALQRRQTRYAIRFTKLDVLESVTARPGPRRRYVPPALYLLGAAALLVGLGRPQAVVKLPREEATIVLALDSSESMEATDVAPSRLEAAKAAAKTFVAQLPPKFQIGVVSFSDRAQVLAHPTIDRTAVVESIDSLVPTGSTALGDAIARSLRLGPRQAPPPEADADEEPAAAEPAQRRPLAAIVLLSDGRNTAGRIAPLEASARAEEAGLPVFTIALGPPEEAVAESQDRIGVVPIQPPDYATLRAIADVTEAEYFSAPTRGDLRRIYEVLASRLGFVKDHQEITFAFAAAGLLLAGLGATLSALWASRFP